MNVTSHRAQLRFSPEFLVQKRQVGIHIMPPRNSSTVYIGFRAIDYEPAVTPLFNIRVMQPNLGRTSLHGNVEPARVRPREVANCGRQNNYIAQRIFAPDLDLLAQCSISE